MTEKGKGRKTGRRRRTTRKLSKRPIRVPGDEVPRSIRDDGESEEEVDVEVDVADEAEGRGDETVETQTEPDLPDMIDVDLEVDGHSASAQAEASEEFESFESSLPPPAPEPEEPLETPGPPVDAEADVPEADGPSDPEASDEQDTNPRIEADAVDGSVSPEVEEAALEEPTQPRIDMNAMGLSPGQPGGIERDSVEDAQTNPRIDMAALNDHSRQGVVVVAPPTVISDRPPPSLDGPPSAISDRPPPDLDAPVPERQPRQPAPSVDSELLEDDLVDVSEELDEPPRGTRTPPPPPPDPSKAPAPPDASSSKAPPPPPKVEPVKKKPRGRQWWEKFFSDDYLMSVLKPTPQQVARQVDFLVESLGLEKGATILDVGCGLGQQALELSRRGMLVVALDLSLPMITRAAEEAQHNNAKINFLHTDMRDIEFEGTFDAIVCLGTTFGFFDDDSNKDVMRRLHQAMRPGGRVLLDVVNRDFVMPHQPNLVWFQGEDCVCMEESDFNYYTSRLIVKRTMMREDGTQSDAEYSVRLYSLHELGQLMQGIGFRVIEVSGLESTRGVFFGCNSQRMLILGERRTAGRQSVVATPDQLKNGGEG